MNPEMLDVSPAKWKDIRGVVKVEIQIKISKLKGFLRCYQTDRSHQLEDECKAQMFVWTELLKTLEEMG